MVKCTSHGFGTYFFIGLAGIGLLFAIYELIFDLESIIAEKEDLFAFVVFCIGFLLILIYSILLLTNFSVYTNDDEIVYIDWKKKRRVFYAKDLKKTRDDNKRIIYRFSNGSIILMNYYRNFDIVSDQIQKLLQNYGDE